MSRLVLRLESHIFEEKLDKHGEPTLGQYLASDMTISANSLNMIVVRNINGRDMVAKPNDFYQDVYKLWLRPTTYTCEFCGNAADKHSWGPGRTTCPNCGKVAKTAEESR